jgi:hypothetical protein
MRLLRSVFIDSCAKRLLCCVSLLAWGAAPPFSNAQDIDALRNAVVKITSMLDGKRRIGTGLVVQVSNEAAYIATASHVIEGDNAPKVEFFSRQNAPVDAEVVKLEGGDPRGLALLAVRDRRRVPREARALPVTSDAEAVPGDDVIAIGFPEGAGPWAVVKANVASRDGRDLVLSGDLAEGNSGGPVIRDGAVVGLVTSLQGQFARATPAPILRIALQGWGLKLRAAAPTSTTDRPTGRPESPPDGDASREREAGGKISSAVCSKLSGGEYSIAIRGEFFGPPNTVVEIQVEDPSWVVGRDVACRYWQRVSGEADCFRRPEQRDRSTVAATLNLSAKAPLPREVYVHVGLWTGIDSVKPLWHQVVPIDCL